LTSIFLVANEISFWVTGSISQRVWFEQRRTWEATGFQATTHGL